MELNWNKLLLFEWTAELSFYIDRNCVPTTLELKIIWNAAKTGIKFRRINMKLLMDNKMWGAESEFAIECKV